MKPILYLVIPCYNEEEVLSETAGRLQKKMRDLMQAGKIAPKSRVVFVNDGSKDRTWELIEQWHHTDPLFGGICLTRNKGHQNALLAGLMTVKSCADIVISMDADLQDDINAIDGMVDAYMEGNDIVYGVRSSRKTDTRFKRMTAEAFYKLMKFMGVDIVFNHADYRLMSRRALEGLEQFDEVNLFLRGIVPLIGYRSSVVEYERAERFAGETKYPLKKMLSFAFDGITSFSVKPIRMLTGLGAVLLLTSLLGLGISWLVHLCMGWYFGSSSVILASVWAVGGLQLLGMGLIGEYIGKIYGETKHRPKFLILQTVLDQEQEIE